MTPEPIAKRTTAQGPNWAAAEERGSIWALRFVAWCLRRIGPGALRILVPPIAAYYTVFARDPRRASDDFLARVDRAKGSDRKAPLTGPALRMIRVRWSAYRHFHKFAELLLDRFLLMTGRFDEFEIVFHGEQEMAKYFETGTGPGAILLGAHLGNFDVLRVIARNAGIVVNVLMYAANAQRINAIFETLDPDCNIRIIDVGPTSVSAAFQIRRCLQRGECVAVLADRLRPGGRSRVSYASFLGEQAAFPQGPFLLPMVMNLPVILTLALKTGPRRYEVFLELMSEGDAVPRRQRDKELRERVEKFAARLEHYTLMAPDQWGNFYDFWDTDKHEHS